MAQSRAPLIVAIVLLLLPVLYLGSYLALVDPRGKAYRYRSRNGYEIAWTNYRYWPHVTDSAFWPLEKIDRKLRPGAWDAWGSELPGAFDSPLFP